MKRLVYIESTGTQYIDTGVVANQDIGFELDFLTSSPLTSSDARHILSAVESSTNRINLALYTAYSGGEFFFGPNEADPGIIVGERITIRFRDNALTTPDGTQAVTAATFDTGLNLLLCARNNAGTVDRYSSNRVYRLKLWSGDSLIRDFIPMLDDEGTACLYDQVNEAFYYNAGTGSFTAGPEVFEGRQGRGPRRSGGGSGAKTAIVTVVNSGETNSAGESYLVLSDGTKIQSAGTHEVIVGTTIMCYASGTSSAGTIYLNGSSVTASSTSGRKAYYMYEVSGPVSISMMRNQKNIRITEGG